MKVGIVDFGMGNINSVVNALNFLGCENKIIRKKVDFHDVTHIILPGVGSFNEAMSNLKNLDFINTIKKFVLKENKKILGICLGMQLLGSSSTENGYTEGFSFVANKVKKFSILETKNKNIPHVGFNNIKIINNESGFFNKLNNFSNFYFVHSYRMLPENLIKDFAICSYGINFIAAFKFRNIYGVQFHPEKSQSCGLQLLYNFLKD